jgi:hypothetical protein
VRRRPGRARRGIPGCRHRGDREPHQQQLTSKIQAELASTTDDAEQARLRELAGVRIVGAQFDQSTLPNLMVHLTVRLGEVLYTEYVWAVQRWERPSLSIGDDPVLLLSIKDPTRCGSYSQVAMRGPEPLSLWLPPAETVRRATAAMRGHHLIVMPLGPRHLLTLSPATLMKPGRYDMPADSAAAYNSMLVAASVRWVCATPAERQRRALGCGGRAGHRAWRQAARFDGRQRPAGQAA